MYQDVFLLPVTDNVKLYRGFPGGSVVKNPLAKQEAWV